MSEEERIAFWRFNAAYARMVAARCDMYASAVKATGSINRLVTTYLEAATREANELLETHPDLAEVNAMANGFYE